MEVFRVFADEFWNPSIWLPPNITWKDLESTDEVQYSDYRHLIYPLPLAILMLLTRYVLEKYWFSPVGIAVGIKNSKSKSAPPNVILEKAFISNSKWKHKEISGLAKQLDWSERQVERWLRLRRSHHKPTTLIKFCECFWRGFYYSFSFIFGLISLWDKPWLWNIDACWYNYPYQNVSNEIWWYYMMSLAFYWSLAGSQFTDVKRKDFWQMFLHHIVTIFLLSFSWICNFHRIGSLVLVTHDSADIFLEGAKMAKYAKYQRICDFVFAIFFVVWIITRLGFFPFWIIRSTSIEAPVIVGTPMFPAYYIFNGFLILLFCLHLFWTSLIMKIVYQSLVTGHMEKDLRSASSDDVSSDDLPVSTANDHTNYKPTSNHGSHQPNHHSHGDN